MINKKYFLEKYKSTVLKLQPNQNKISIPVLNRICLKMQHGINFMPIYNSSGNIIVNGHHRYVASIIADYGLDIVNNYPIETQIIDLQWETVEFIEDDWDSPAKVSMLNEIDADYNGMTVKEIESILKQK